MKIFNNLNRKNQGETSVALGYFDGVHIGHRRIILSASRSGDAGPIPIAFTFNERPGSFLNGTAERKITDLSKKAELLSSMGIEELYVVDFFSVMNLTAEEFVHDVLYEKLNAKRAVCGFNYGFGAGGKSGPKELKVLCGERGIEAEVLDAVEYKGLPVSSSRIRKAVSDGDAAQARALLGRFFSFKSRVVRGRGMGKGLGMPTANQKWDDSILIPKRGVYSSFAEIGGRVYSGVTNVGTRPTFNGSELSIETWFPRYEGADFYGVDMEIFFIRRIRDEIKFDNPNELTVRASRDAELAFKSFREEVRAEDYPRGLG